MKVLVSGASGMIGSVVAPHLESQGHQVVRLVRREPGPGELFWNPDDGIIDRPGVEGFDGVVNLASMPWPARWTGQAKQRIRANRMATNGLLSKTLGECQRKPDVFVCASGMGIYPSSGETELTEESPLGTDFLAMLQRDGEAAAEQASAAGIRVVNLRIPAVLGGTALRRNLGRMGSGRQWSSWVARDELAHIISYVLDTDSLDGPVNPVSPNPIRNAEFVATLSRVLGSKPGLPIPAFILKLMLGEMADALLLASRRIIPGKLLESGYQFLFPGIESAFEHELAVVAGEV